MKQLKIAAVLLMTAVTPIWAQAPADHDAHHPAESAAPTPAPAQTTPQATQPSRAPGMMGGMPIMMEMMSRNMPMMNMMRMMTGMPGAGMATIDRVEGRIAFLRTELKITDAQTNAFNTFADVLRANARRLGELRPSMMMGQQAQVTTLADRLDLQERWLTARLEGTRALKSAFVILSGVLSDEQKQTANELLAPHMGMMTMMSGMMSSGPGQTMPGPIMRQPAPQPGN